MGNDINANVAGVAAESPLGTVRLEAVSRRNRWRTQVSLQCDAYAVNADRTLLLVSALGPESAVKALVAALNCETNVTFEFTFPGGGDSYYRVGAWDGGYRVYRTRAAAGLWHVVAHVKESNFLPVYDDEALWELLRGDRYSTPVLREWLPYLVEQVRERHLARVTQVGCSVAGLSLTDEQLDAIVRDGLRSGAIAIPGDSPRLRRAEMPADLDGYMLENGPLLARRAERALDPLHVPGRDPLPRAEFLRRPFEPQWHVIAAAAKALKRQKSVFLVGEMGVGKTLAAQCTAHVHANGRPYRALVFCPGQLAKKWAREIEETIPGARVTQIETWRDVLALDPSAKPAGPEWYVIPRDRAKLGHAWRAACWQRERITWRLREGDEGLRGPDGVRCPDCGERLRDKDGGPLDRADLARSKQRCESCGGALWQADGKVWRYEPALYVKRRLKGFFKYLVLDEVHEEKSATSAQGNAAGSLAAACGKVIACTGTLIGGYAEHLRPLLFRLAPSSLIGEGLGWADATAFSECYGRIETVITEKEGGGDDGGADNLQSRGKTSRSVRRSVKPGVMPALFGRHLIGKAVFLGLSEVADNLPECREEAIPVEMDGDLASAYGDLERRLMDVIKDMLRQGDHRMLSTMLQALLCYPDHPFGWGEIGYRDETGGFVPVCEPRELDDGVTRAKERALLDLVRAEKAAGRQVWVYVTFNGARDVQGRVERLLKGAGLKAGVLRASVKLAEREAWIAKNAPGLDVVISHPKLVETGLDFFDKKGTYNACTIIFYEEGYNLFTLRQASRRAWRIGQTKPCKVYYLYYAGTMQEKAMALMGRKMQASLALEGKFSADGLAALAGEEGSMEMAMARSLVERMDEGDVRRVWAKVGGGPAPAPGPGRDDDPGGTPAPAPAPAPDAAPARDRAPRLVQPSLPWGGPDLVAEMRRGKVLVADLAAELGVPARKVTAARKGGVAAADRAGWETAVRAVASRKRDGAVKPPAAKKPRPRRAAAKSSERGRAK